MSQDQFAQHGTSERAFGEKSDTTLKIGLAIGFAVLGGLGVAQWAFSASNAESAKSSVTVEAKKSADPVYRCADGRVSFNPCS